jgi:hypothetical protein
MTQRFRFHENRGQGSTSAGCFLFGSTIMLAAGAVFQGLFPQARLHSGTVFDYCYAIGILGALLCIRAWTGKSRWRRAQRGDPWMQDYAWDPRGTMDETRRNAWRYLNRFALCAAVFLLLDAGWVYNPKGWAIALLVLSIANATTVGWLLWSLWLFIRSVRNGNMSLAFVRFPFFLGETLEVTLRSAAPSPETRVTLRCLRET